VSRTVRHLSIRKSFLAYIKSHRDAWDSAITYFGSTSDFQDSVEEQESNETIWNTYINIPHYARKSKDLDQIKEEEYQMPLFISEIEEEGTSTGGNEQLQTSNVRRQSTAGKKFEAMIDACISICITGDKVGEFWTSSILGSSWDDVDIVMQRQWTKKVSTVIKKYKYDRRSARYLVFILQLTFLCRIISERHESIIDELKKQMDLEVRKVYGILFHFLITSL
jgi:hypothetical protein